MIKVINNNLWNCHHSPIVQNSNNKHHKWWEIKFPNEAQKAKPHNNTNGNGHCVDCVVLHSLKDGSACQDCMDNDTQSCINLVFFTYWLMFVQHSHMIYNSKFYIKRKGTNKDNNSTFFQRQLHAIEDCR